MDAPQRHIDDGRGLWRYAGLIDVRCPRCAQPGQVRAPSGQDGEVRFACTGCGLSAATVSCCGLHAAQRDWYGPVRLYGRRPCGYCGHQWLGVDRIYDGKPAHTPQRLSVRCRVCARDSEVEVQTTPHRGHEPRDPHLGLPLRLLEPTRHGLLWAYNAQHLDELRRYVAATQRERLRSAGNASMISRLPAWMKLARHRTAMLKALDRLDARLRADDGAEAATATPARTPAHGRVRADARPRGGATRRRRG
ncbi:hypothetical protein PRJ39_19735 [Lysobacter enzymogenes]|uniref:hypothetical protein n=1 Tax=Lysobacter enzymogenes TaxID=69 RepID=UPI00374A70DE